MRIKNNCKQSQKKTDNTIKRLSRDLFPQKVGLFLIFCLQEGISEDLKIWHILFRQGLGRSRDRAEGIGKHRIPRPPSWPGSPAGSEGHSVHCSGDQLPSESCRTGLLPWGERKRLSLVEQASFTLLSKCVWSQRLLETKLQGIYERHHPAPTAFTSPVVCTLLILKVLFGTEMSAFVVLRGPHTVSSELNIYYKGTIWECESN